MTRSMTAFSRCSESCDLGLLTLEIHSLNRRHLEIQTLLPREFLSLDALIKKQVHQKLCRGQIQIYLNYSPSDKAKSVELHPNLPLAKEIKNAWFKIKEALNLDLSQEGLEQLLIRESQLLQAQVDPSFCAALKPVILNLLGRALDQLCEMRETEGAFLKQDLIKRTEEISKYVKQVEALFEKNTVEIQRKLKERIEKLLDQKIVDEERLIKEAAFLADKSDVSEEVLRIQSHLNQFAQTLEDASVGKGKMLDFISQELHREWNTIGSKCSDREISQCVLLAKSECEKIREQIHNIE